jgi:hypothetical protein
MAMAAVASASSSSSSCTSPLLLVASAQYTSGSSRVSSRLLLRSSLKPTLNRSFQACKVPYVGVNGGDYKGRRGAKNLKNCKVAVVVAGILPVDPWAPNTDTQSIASSLFAASLFPYLGFLYHIHKSETSPKITLFGFYFLLAFVGATSKCISFAQFASGSFNLCFFLRFHLK